MTSMSTETLHTIEEDIETATAAFIAGRPVPPEVDARIAERAAEARERVFREHGELDISVTYVRQSRETGH